MSNHILFLFIAGLAMLGMFFLPRVLGNRLLSIPIVYVVFGMLIFRLPLELPVINPNVDKWDNTLMEYISEFIVIISLVATGIKIDRRPTWKNWKIGWYLLGIAMPICIATVAWLGWAWMGLTLPAAALLGAVLAPTDPVLAGNVQVGPPNKGGEDIVRFSLTLEAGLNDGLAFPFVYLAIAVVGADALGAALLDWALLDLLYRVGMGVLIGWLAGRLLSRFFFHQLRRMDEASDTEFREGIFIIAATLLTYSAAELAEGYGFLAVFVAAVVGRNYDASHESHMRTYKAIDQVEQALLGTFLIGFGGMLATGILDSLTWPGAAVGLLLLLVIRPLSALIAFLSLRIGFPQKLVISFFGIRGIGSIYYLTYAANEATFININEVWATVSFTILCSILLHGISVKPMIAWVDNWRQRNAHRLPPEAVEDAEPEPITKA